MFGALSSFLGQRYNNFRRNPNRVNISQQSSNWSFAAICSRRGFGCIILRGRGGVTWKYRTLLARCEYGVCTHCEGMYRTWFEGVWLSGCFRFVPKYIRYIQWVETPYSHVASNVRYVTHLGVLTHLSFPLRTNSVLTPCKQGAVLSRYSIS